MDRRVGFARDGSNGFDKGLNWRGWVAVSCLVGEVWVLCFGRHWSRSGFFFFFFNMSFCSSGILVGSGQWWRGGHGGGAVVVTG